MSAATMPPTKPVLLTVPEVCAHLRISRWMFYQLINRRELRTITIGSRRLVTEFDLNAYVRHRQETAS